MIENQEIACDQSVLKYGLDYETLASSLIKVAREANPSNTYGLESAGVFVKGFVATMILTANPVLGATNGALSLTAFHIHAFYMSHTR